VYVNMAGRRVSQRDVEETVCEHGRQKSNTRSVGNRYM
jgi:hypothetical protein